jgi:tetratricopeptide (TPR) repeat protein
VKKQQWIIVLAGIILVVVIYIGGKTTGPKSDTPAAGAPQSSGVQPVTTELLLAKAKQRLSPEQVSRLAAIESSVKRGDVKDQQLHVYHQLSKFWKDSVRMFEPYAYYNSEAAKLENSEKSLTFAAQLFLDNLLSEGDPAMQHWLGENAKVLLDKALVINPANDSSKIGLGICYMFGNITDNPMQGIMEVRKVVQEHPENLYGQMVLGMGGKKSGQYDKAIERFKIVLNKEPENLEAIFNLAETFELKGDKANAVIWYQKARDIIKVPDAKIALDKRIKELKK